MAHYVQVNAGEVPLKRVRVYYEDSGSDGHPEIGYLVCYKHDAPLTPAAGDFDDQQFPRVVTKPKTANLMLFAGIVVENRADGSDGMITIAVPQKHDVLQCWTHVNATALTTVLQLANNDWGLVAQTLTAEAVQQDTIGMAAKTYNTSSTAALGYVKFL